MPAHRSRLVREFIELSEGHIATEYLPPNAPELNPVEYISAYRKQHELPNVGPKDYYCVIKSPSHKKGIARAAAGCGGRVEFAGWRSRSGYVTRLESGAPRGRTSRGGLGMPFLWLGLFITE